MGKFNVYNWKNKILESQSNLIEKSIQDVTWEDVEGLSVPTLDFGVKRIMDDRPIFDDQWRQETLDNWKNQISSKYPNAIVTIDKSKDYVEIQDEKYKSDMESLGKNIQADYEKNRNR
jgi:hypothetical protein